MDMAGQPTGRLPLPRSGSPGEITVEIRDWGKPINPAKLPRDYAPPADIDKIKPGGLGLLCIRKMMDRVQYQPMPDGTLLKLTKLAG